MKPKKPTTAEKKFVSDKDLSRVVVDTTVQEKNITFPTDSKLLSRAIIKLGKQAKHHGITLRQSYARKAKHTARKASGYAAARQYGRLKRSVKDLKNWLGRILRDIDRKRKNTMFSTNFSIDRNVEETFVAGKKHAEDFWQSCQHFSVTNCKSHEHRASRWSALLNFYGTFMFTA